jgi:glycosyltransferase involved in cell wall biosynthesis
LIQADLNPANPKSGLCILYFYTRDASFIRKDLEMLRTRFEVIEMAFPAPEKWKVPLLFLRQLLFLVRHTFYRRNFLVMAQFAGYHSLLPCFWSRLFGWKSIIVAGGADCVAFPSLKYGNFQNRLLAVFTRLSYRLCHTVSAVHDCLFLREDHYGEPSESRQGILHFMPEAKFQKNVIYNGFDTQRFRILLPWEERPQLSFLSISADLTDPVRMKLKGSDQVLELAELMPEASFTLVGCREAPSFPLPPNVRLLPPVDNRDLPEICNRHRFYLQLSLSEGFPNALCEAMACGCIPVVSEVASMPFILDGSGGIAKKRDVASIRDAVREAEEKAQSPGCAEHISRSIQARFSWERRQNALWNLIEETAGKL